MKIKIIFCVFSLIFAFIFPAFAATRGIFFGTSKFDSAHDLPACENDAMDAYTALHKSMGLDQLTRQPFCGQNSKELIKRYIQEAAGSLKKGDTLLIFNASHGSKNGDIVCSNAHIAPAELADWIKDSKCSNIVLINDSCFSSKFAQEFHKEMIHKSPGKTIAQLAAANPERVSFSSRLDTAGMEVGHKNGIFTKYFIEALDPKVADYDGDGKITILEILRHVKKGMLSDEHKGLIQWFKDNDPNHYNMTDEEINAKITAWTDYYNQCLQDNNEVEMKKALGWLRRYELIRDLKLGQEGQRWQDPVAFGDINFVLVGKKEEMSEEYTGPKVTFEQALEVLQAKEQVNRDYHNCNIAYQRGYHSNQQECEAFKKKYEELNKEYEKLHELYKKQTGKSHLLEAKEKGY